MELFVSERLIRILAEKQIRNAKFLADSHKIPHLKGRIHKKEDF